MEDQKFFVDGNLVEWLLQAPDECFPLVGSEKYKKRYESIVDYLICKVYPEVTQGAMIKEVEKMLEEGNLKPEAIIYLTNHGKTHIDTVIQRASSLLQKSTCKLTPYEGYILLLAIHFHDVGNIYGRTNHEQKCKEIMSRLGVLAGEDEPEKRVIIKVASAHGGYINNSKDTISSLNVDHPVLGKRVRKRLLAAILRFADEIADDSTRASRFLFEENSIPVWSRVYHAYSISLHSVLVDENQIELAFEIEKDMILEKFVKHENGVDEEIFLIDEIYERTMKMHRERVYCMRFLRPDFDIQKIKVTIEIYDKNEIVHGEKIQYTLEDSGYPDKHQDGIYSICPMLQNYTGEKIEQKFKS